MFRKDSSSKAAGRPSVRRLAFVSLVALVIVTTALAFLPSLQKVHAASNGPSLSVDATTGRHAISPDIYGMNLYGVDENLAKELKLPVERWGGNNTSRYNWQVDSSNSGDNYYYIGGGDGVYMGGSNAGTGNGVPGAAVDRFVKNAHSQGIKAMITAPIIPYINKTSAFNCSYPRSLYPPQQYYSSETLPNGDTCGNGHDTSGNAIDDTNVELNNTSNNPDILKAWVQHLIDTHGRTDGGGVNFYEMDNEVSYWYATHHDVHPAYTGFNELVNLTETYARAIKDVDSSALITGPSDFGWWGYIGEQAPQGDGRAEHGNLWRVEYYLQQLKAYQDRTGVRLLDYMTQNYYPNGRSSNCFGLCSAGDTQNQKDRLQATRSLWDPTYTDNSWIGDQYGVIKLIPRMHDWVNNYYPGTKTGITEYNFGGLEAMNGALTQADVLGIFGREGLDFATIWGPPASNSPGAYAFRMYLNYDGNGSRYGDTWINASSSDQGQLAVYAAQRSSDSATTLMVINKTDTDLTSNLALTGVNANSNAQVYTYSGANLSKIVRESDLSTSASGFGRTYPANSISLIVIPKGASQPGLLANGTYKITAKHSGKVLGVANGSTDDQALIEQEDWSSANSQKWNVQALSDGSYKVISVNSQKALDVKYGGTSDGTPLWQWQWNDSCAQHWRLSARSDGAYTATSGCSDKVWDVQYQSTASGAQLTIYTANGGQNQAFTFEPV